MNVAVTDRVKPPLQQKTISKDFWASIVVFLVALPLCMGISIASGVPPTAGLITGILGGLVVGFLAGSPLQVSGPAAGLTVLVWHLVQQQGFAMLGVVVLLAGLIQLVAGLLKLGQWFRAVSPAVIQGMLSGIGVLIIASQFHVMLDKKPIGTGIQNFDGMPFALFNTLTGGGASLHALLIGLLTLAVIVLWTKFSSRRFSVFPATLLAVLVAVVASYVMQLNIQYIPDLLPHPEDIDKVWSVIHYPTIKNLQRLLEPDILIAAVSIAFIASAETLLCASALDLLHQGPRTKYDRELAAQGVGNILCGLLGVIPMTGVIARSSANVEAGALTRNAAVFHGAWLLLFAVVFPFTLRYIPVSSLAAVLVYTGYKLAYPKAVPDLLKYGKSEVAIYLVTIIAVVTLNLLEGVLIGLGLSILKLLYAFSHLEIIWDEDLIYQRTRLHLKGAATLIRLPLLAEQLEKVRPGSEVELHVEDLNYIDHACLELISNWEKQHNSTGGSLKIEWEALSNKYRARHSD